MPIVNGNGEELPLKGKVMVATPSLSGDAWFSYFDSFMHSVFMCLNKGWDIQTNAMMGNSCISLARAIIVQDFWDSDCDQLFCIDADIHWDPEAFVRFVESEHEIIAGLYPRRSPGQKKFVTRGVFDGVGEKMIHTRGCGFGFIRIKRSAIKKMRDAYPDLRARDKMRRRWMYMLFDPMIVDFEPLGEDFAFCERWCRLGERIYCEPDLDFSHYGTAIYSGNFSKHQSDEILDWTLKPEGEAVWQP